MDDIVSPLSAMSNMAGLVEAAVERAREEKEQRTPGSATGGPKRPGESEGGDDRGKKKARFSSNAPAVVEAQPLPQTYGPLKDKSKVKKTHVHAYPDVVDEGFCSEEEARELIRM